MSEERVVEALRALAEHDRGAEAPPQVEDRVLRAFRRRGGRRVWPWAAVAAALVVAIFLWKSGHPPQAPAQLPPPAVTRTVIPVPAEPVVVKLRRRSVPAPHREAVTDFFPLIDVAPPFERGALVRVNLPAAALRTVGVPVAEDHLADRVQADVLVSEEGLPRAIRFVKFQQ